MVEENKKENKEFLSYVDDDGTIKNQFVIILKENEIGVEFKFDSSDVQTIVIPWHKINKLKRRNDNGK